MEKLRAAKLLISKWEYKPKIFWGAPTYLVSQQQNSLQFFLYYLVINVVKVPSRKGRGVKILSIHTLGPKKIGTLGFSDFGLPT